MTLFSTFDTAGSGLRVMRTWMDAVGDNIANVSNVTSSDQTAFQARYVVANAADYGQAGQDGITAGVKVGGIVLGDPQGRLVYQPDHPLADAQGLVRMPDIDMGEQMTQLIIAQRGYQANLAVFDRARDAYLQALNLGKA